MANIHVLAKVIDRSVGSAIYTTELIRRLALRSHQITLICQSAPPEVEGCFQILRLNRPSLAQAPLLWRGAAVIEMAAAWQTIRSARIDAPDVVIGSAQQLIWAHQRVYPQVPLMYVPHSLITPLEIGTYTLPSWFQKKLTVQLFDWLERDALRRAVTTVRFTQTGCRALEKYYGLWIARRFNVLPIPIEMPEVRKTTSADVIRLLYVGRLVKSKNVDLIIRSLAKMRHLAWRLDVVGNGEEKVAWEQLVQKLTLGGQIIFHGHQDDVTPWYRQADLFVFPSCMESAGLVLLEAMSHGVPPLAMRADGGKYQNVNDELIDNGRNGFLAGSEEDFTHRLAELLTNPVQVQDAGRQARLTAERHHQWVDHVDRFEQLIFQVLQGRQ